MLSLALPTQADTPTITAVKSNQGTDGWSFDVSLLHPDSGWDHYADGWRVLDMDGKEIDMHVLSHPHVNEQPFTRSLVGVQVPQGTTQVQIEARCLVDGWTGQPVAVSLP